MKQKCSFAMTVEGRKIRLSPVRPSYRDLGVLTISGHPNIVFVPFKFPTDYSICGSGSDVKQSKNRGCYVEGAHKLVAKMKAHKALDLAVSTVETMIPLLCI